MLVAIHLHIIFPTFLKLHELLLLYQDTFLIATSHFRKSSTIQDVAHLLLSFTSATHTATRSARSCSSPSKACTPVSSCTAERRPSSPSETCCHLDSCLREPSSATSRRRPETVERSPEHRATTPQSSPTTPTPSVLASSFHREPRKFCRQLTAP